MATNLEIEVAVDDQRDSPGGPGEFRHG